MRLAITAALAALTIPVVAQNITGTISGRVISAVTGNGIAGVDVTAFTRQAVRYPTTTGANGSFRITGVAPDHYEFRFEKEGYRQGFTAPTPTIDIDATHPEHEVTLSLFRSIAISGRVTDSDGAPVDRAQIRVQGRAVGTTDEEGRFTTSPLEPGYYRLLATPATSGTGESENEDPLLPTFYPSALTQEGAQSIILNSDQDINGINIEMRRGPVYQISGIVLDPDGNPAPDATVTLHPIEQQPARLAGNTNGIFLTFVTGGEGAGAPMAETRTGDDGSFGFSSAPPGRWRVDAVHGGILPGEVFNPAAQRFARTEINLSREDVYRVKLTLGNTVLLMQEASPETGQSPHPVALISTDSLAVRSTSVPFLPPTNGVLRLPAVPGRYYLAPRITGNQTVRGVRMNGANVFNQPVNLLADAEIEVDYGEANGTVRGQVSGNGLHVVLMPQNLTGIAYGRLALLDEAGRFEMDGVAPGGYFAVAFTGPDLRNWITPEVIQKIAARGSRITVSDGGTAEVRLTAIPWLE